MLGFPLGVVVGGSVLLHNHLRFVVRYSEESAQQQQQHQQQRRVRVTGLEVLPRSRDYASASDARYCMPSAPLDVSEAAHKTVYWTYTVTFVRDTRQGPRSRVTLVYIRKDLRSPEGNPWASAALDVLCYPRRRALLSVSVGVGLQALAVLSVAAACVHAGWQLSAPVLLLAVPACCLPVGYCCRTLHRLVGGWPWQATTACTALVPLALLCAYAACDCLGLFVWNGVPSAASLPAWSYALATYAVLFVLVPLALAGGHLARKGSPLLSMVTCGPHVPRATPLQPWSAYTVVLPALCGLITFGATDVQLHYLLASFAGGVAYDNLWGHLCAALALTVLACAVTSVVAVHNQLSAGNGDWWWTGFLTGASSAVFCLGYALCFLWARGGVGTAGGLAVLMLCCASGAVLMFFAAGAVGFCSSLVFVSALRRAVVAQLDTSLALVM
eukprot:m51a1_g13467 hypothetical protein (443) ;mRNA; f:366-1890